MKSRAPFLIVIAAARGEINLTGNNSRNRIKYPLSLTQLRSGTQASDCPSTEKEARFEIKAR